jgi:hypothetical protein
MSSVSYDGKRMVKLFKNCAKAVENRLFIFC